jgi:HSP20 family protein
MNTQMRVFNPWKDLERFRSELDQMFNRTEVQEQESSVSDWMPAVDVREETDRYIIEADVPGVDPADIEVHMENGVLTIKGERSSEKKESREGYRRIERAYGTFYRRFNLPELVDAENIKASSRHGVLEVVIPKQAQVMPKRITVES